MDRNLKDLIWRELAPMSIFLFKRYGGALAYDPDVWAGSYEMRDVPKLLANLALYVTTSIKENINYPLTKEDLHKADPDDIDSLLIVWKLYDHVANECRRRNVNPNAAHIDFGNMATNAEQGLFSREYYQILNFFITHGTLQLEYYDPTTAAKTHIKVDTVAVSFAYNPDNSEHTKTLTDMLLHNCGGTFAFVGTSLSATSNKNAVTLTLNNNGIISSSFHTSEY